MAEKNPQLFMSSESRGQVAYPGPIPSRGPNTARREREVLSNDGE